MRLVVVRLDPGDVILPGLTSGRLDAVLAGSPILDFAAKANPGIEISSQYDFAPVGVGLPIESGLVKSVSAVMEDIVKTDSYLQVLKKYGLASSANTGNVRNVLAIILILIAASAALDVATNERCHRDVVVSYLFSPEILTGAGLTLVLTVVSMTVGILLGTALAVMRLSSNPILKTLSRAYIWFFRGTPLLVRLIFWYNMRPSTR